MPAAIAIPLAIAGATMVASNVQQKAAIKNNDNQQHAAVQNAQNATNAAEQRQSNWLQHNPAPFAGGFNIARPPGYAGSAAPAGQPGSPLSPAAVMQSVAGHTGLPSQQFPNGTPAAPWSDYNAALHSINPNLSAGFHAGAFGSPAQMMSAAPRPSAPPIGSGTGVVNSSGAPGMNPSAPAISPQSLMQNLQSMLGGAAGGRAAL